MIRIIFEGFMLGLSTGAYCLGSCFVFFMPYLLVEGKPRVSENFRKIFFFMLGRFVSYIGFAFAMGTLFDASSRDIFNARFSNMSLVAISLLMLFYVLTHQSGESSLCKIYFRKSALSRMPFFLGVFTGLNPCLPFLVGISRLWTLGSIGGGVLLFAGFFAGTSVYMAPLIFVSYLNRMQRIRQIGFMLALLSSIWFLFVGLSGLVHAGNQP